MCQTTHLQILDLVTFSDLTLTLTWAKYETISLFSTFAWSLGVHMESFGRNMLRLRSLRSATWKHPILTFDLTLTWHVTSILNFRKWFGSVSSRSFEFRLVRLSTSIRFRDRRGVGFYPPPPQAVVGTETAQAVAGIPGRRCRLFERKKITAWVGKRHISRQLIFFNNTGECVVIFLPPWFLFLDTVVLFIYNIGFWFSSLKTTYRAAYVDAGPRHSSSARHRRQSADGWNQDGVRKENSASGATVRPRRMLMI